MWNALAEISPEDWGAIGVALATFLVGIASGLAGKRNAQRKGGAPDDPVLVGVRSVQTTLGEMRPDLEEVRNTLHRIEVNMAAQRGGSPH